MAIKKLIVETFKVTKEDHESGNFMPAGETYTYFCDPEIGKYYRPTESFMVTTDHEDGLDSKFVEIE